MLIVPSALPLPRFEFEVGLGVDLQPMTGGGAQQERLWEHLPLIGTATWRLALAQRAQLLDLLDGAGPDRFWARLRVPQDPRPWRSVQVRQTGPWEIVPATRSHDDVSVPLSVEAVPIIIDFGALLAPDGAPLAAGDGAELHWEDMG